ncbi:hypothetical protein, partial [Campylobacter upsaliensis]
MSSKKPLLSLVCIFALTYGVKLQANDVPKDPESHKFTSVYNYTMGNTSNQTLESPLQTGSNIIKMYCTYNTSTRCKYDKEYTKINFASHSSPVRWDYQNTSWNKLTIESMGSEKKQEFWLNNVTIEEANMKGNTRMEWLSKTGSNTITTLNHDATYLKFDAQNSNALTITTFNQNSGTTEISSNSIKIENFKLNAGSVNNNGGTITTLTSNQGGNITNAGTITSLTYTAAPTTKAIQTKASTDSITNTGTITTFTNNGGNLTNTGSIQTYTQESGNTMQSGGTIQTLTQKGGNFTYQGGTIGSLNQEGGSFTYAGGQINNLTQSGGNFNNLQQNISLFTTQGGSLNNIQGTIDTLKITSGDFELNNMQQGRIANIEIGGNGNININDNMNIGYNKGISTFRIASGATPTLNFGEVRTATTAQETYATVKLVDSTNNANTTQARVAIDKLTIALVGEDTQIGKSVSLANSVSGAANSGVGNVYVKSADFSQDLKQSGFYGTFNAQTQTIDTRFNANLGAAGLFSQVFINQLGRRSLLFDSFLNEASRASLRYKRTQPDTNFDIFVRPY